MNFHCSQCLDISRIYVHDENQIQLMVYVQLCVNDWLYIYPVVADASSQVLIFWLHGNGFGDKKRTLVLNVQSIGNSVWPLITTTSYKTSKYELKEKSYKYTNNKNNISIIHLRRQSTVWMCAERLQTIWHFRPGSDNVTRWTQTGWTVHSHATTWTSSTCKRCRRRIPLGLFSTSLGHPLAYSW